MTRSLDEGGRFGQSAGATDHGSCGVARHTAGRGSCSRSRGSCRSRGGLKARNLSNWSLDLDKATLSARQAYRCSGRRCGGGGSSGGGGSGGWLSEATRSGAATKSDSCGVWNLLM